MILRRLEDHLDSIHNKTVLVRTNFDVPIENGVVQDTTRLADSIPTLQALLRHHCQVVMLSHYDRPDGVFSPSKSLEPIIPFVEDNLKHKITFIQHEPDFRKLRKHNDPLILVDNLRFYPEEEENNADFARHLSSLGEAYVNEAFANCHRAHASIVGIPNHIPSYAGISLSKEMEVLTKVTQTPNRPLVVVIGGAKLETKEPLVQAFLNTADTILVGGKIALDLQSKGINENKIIIANLIDDGKDITAESANHFAKIIMEAGTVIWNGSMGVFEEEAYQHGTTTIAHAVNKTPAFTLIGGGDTEAALTQLNLESGIDYISTGGGAMLTFLSEGTLVGLQPLEE